MGKQRQQRRELLKNEHEKNEKREEEFTTDDAIDATQKEAVFYKVLSSKKILCRRFTLDPSELHLHYHPSQKRYFCKGEKPVYDLNNVNEVRKGWNTDLFHKLSRKKRSSKRLKQVSSLEENNCFSLILQNNETIDLVAPDVETRNTWVKALNALIANIKHQQREEQFKKWVRSEFKLADCNNDGALTFKECENLLKHLNISMTERQAKALFEAADIRKSKNEQEPCLDEDEFIKFFISLHNRPELEPVFRKYAIKRSGLMGPEELRAFCQKEQKMYKETLEVCAEFIERYEPKETGASGFLSETGFLFMLSSTKHDIFNEEHSLVHQDMTRPLNHYYIASSHNTYLLEDQLIGDSSVEGYVNALRKGCRCIEIDVWDGAEGQPEVFHGYTLTSKISFIDVLKAINLHAFTETKYPLILSLEVHCSVAQQAVMAQQLKSIFGDQLLQAPLYDYEDCLPSPAELSKKILIKTKKVGTRPLSKGLSKDGSDASSGEPESPDSKGSSKVSNVATELSDLVHYCEAKKFCSFEDCTTWRFGQMISLSEGKSIELTEEQPEKFVELTGSRLCRIYPKGTRTTSSNYDPLIHWNFGCQLVALNYQTPGLPMLLNDAMFTRNGKSGYVLKPGFLRGQKEPKTKSGIVISLRVISGQYIPKPGQAETGEVVDPYVVVRIVGHPSDEQRYKTKCVNNNGFNPIWDEHWDMIVNVPELAFLIFQVHDQSATGRDELLGQYAIAVSSVAEGYRHVHLVDERGVEIVPATIFVHISIKQENLL